MSLSGKVQDLPLLEILQVVAFCQKTGHLTVRTAEGEGAVAFHDGRVVSGYLWDVPPLGNGPDSSPTAREQTIRRRINSVLERLIRLREGEFAFHVGTTAPSRLGGRDLTRETLDDGIHPEELMLQLARQMDEDRRDTAAALGVSFLAPPEPELPDEEQTLEELPLLEEEAGPVVVLVDDEPDVRRIIGERLSLSGLEVIATADVEGGRRAATRLARERRPFLVVTDLGLPSLGGHTFRGGFDVVRHAASLEPRPRILLMADGGDERLRRRARRLGVSFLTFKPSLSKLDPLQYSADLRAFGDKLARDLVPRLLRRTVAGLPAAPPAPPDSSADEPARAALQAALDELARQPEPDVVAFLLLRAARAFFSRAILFLVKDDGLLGLAGFGPTATGESLDLLSRALSVPLDELSPFTEAVAYGRPWAGEPPQGPLRALLDRIGRPGAGAAAVLPVRAHGHTIAVLYGDAGEGHSLSDLAPLVEFAERAGRALDDAFLARRTADNAA